jgi:hypothetical protein
VDRRKFLMSASAAVISIAIPLKATIAMRGIYDGAKWIEMNIDGLKASWAC